MHILILETFSFLLNVYFAIECCQNPETSYISTFGYIVQKVFWMGFW